MTDNLGRLQQWGEYLREVTAGQPGRPRVG